MDSGSKFVAGMLAVSIFQMIGTGHRHFLFWHMLLSAFLGAAVAWGLSRFAGWLNGRRQGR